MSAKLAFKAVISVAGFDRTFDRRETPAVIETVKAAPSNYFRNTIGPEEITINANEIVVDIDDLETYGTPKKGHRVIDAMYGTQTIDTVIPMVAFGEILGFRIRFR